jgi:hypothetical protein
MLYVVSIGVGVLSWFAVNLFGKSFLDFLALRKEIHEELIFLSDVNPPSEQTLHEGAEEDYKEEVRIFSDARQKVRRLGAKMSALNASVYLTPYLLRNLGFDLDSAAKNLLALSTAFEPEDRTVARYMVEVALRLPRFNEWWAQRLIESRTRKREAAKLKRKSEIDVP